MTMITTVYILNYAHRHGVDRFLFEDRADAVAEAYRIMDEYRDDMIAAANARANSPNARPGLALAAVPLNDVFDRLVEEDNLSGATALWLDLLDEDIHIETSDIIPKGGRP